MNSRAALILLFSFLFFVSCTKEQPEKTVDKKDDVEKIKLDGNSASDLLFKLQADKRTKTLQSNNNMIHVRLGPVECLRVGSHGGADLAITTTCLITP